jgi:hypothetical protein
MLAQQSMFERRSDVDRAFLRTLFRVVATLNNDRTRRRSDFSFESADIVKNGTPDQRALLRAE